MAEEEPAVPGVIDTGADAEVVGAANALREGSLSPAAIGAARGPDHASATAIGEYDGSTGKGSFEATTEVRLGGPITVRGAALYTPRPERVRPSFGLRVNALQEERQGIDGSVAISYRPEGLTEPEGEIEVVLALGHGTKSGYLLGNLVYGQDIEGRERDGEVRLSAQRRVTTSLWLGLDGRGRFDLGSATAKLVGSEPTVDVRAGPTASYIIGSVVFLASGGATVVHLDKTTAGGLFLLGGGGTVF